MTRIAHRLAGGGLPLLLALAGGAAAPPALASGPFAATASDRGIEARLELLPNGEALRPGEPVRIRVSFTTAENPGSAAAPLRGARPAAWAERGGGRALECRERVRGLIEKRLGREPEVDFNAWHLAYLGSNGAVQVIDPLGGNARTRLLAALNLGARPGGWAVDAARGTIHVSVPEKGEVVEIDAMRWVERRRIAVGGRPARLVHEAGAARLWIGQDGEEGAGPEIVLLDLNSGEVAARLPAGPGPHRLAATGPGQAVAASAAGAVLLDAEEARPLPGLGGGFDDVAHSTLAGATLLLDAAGGRVIAIRADGRPDSAWEVAASAAGLFLDPAGRLLFVPEAGEHRVTVIDLARGAVAHRVPVEGAPLRIGFSATQAYVQSEAGASVALIALGSLGESGTPAVTTIAAGEGGLVPGEALGPMVASAPGDSGMLIAAPAEGVVHVYMEGMAAPAGLLRVPRGRPLAIAPLDRGLRETAPGQFETDGIFPAAGRYVLPVLLQGNSFLHCFEAEVGGEEVLPLSRRLRLELAGNGAGPAARTLQAGAPASLRLRIQGPEEEGAWREAGDLSARVVQFVGHWQAQLPMRPLGDGLYEVAGVAPPRAGPVTLYVESPSLGLEPGTLPTILLRAVAP
ncbi:hypothetical protein [Muricoccus vinaceus]|uniref:Uncharacterized protein n=1 Tax=Muricoccus vinaceus TaxID=424704 RepID=A0ABV6IXL7_9PROT